MPTRERLQAFVQTVEASRFVEALRDFYVDDATMQENNDPPRGGLDALVAGEERLLRMFKSISTEPGSPYLLDGDQTVVRWVFHFTYPDGTSFRFEEIAHQIWRGDRIVTERFFYDPGQRKTPVAAA